MLYCYYWHISFPCFLKIRVINMDLLTQLLLGMGAFSMIVVVGSFIGIMMVVIEDTIEEHRQARERDKRRE